MPLSQPREPAWAAWGIAASGAKMLSGLYATSKADTARARERPRDLKARGMNAPALIATDGAPGLIRAVEEVFPQSLRQRGLAPTLRDLGAKIPEERWREVKAYALATYRALSPRAARAAAEAFRRRSVREFPSAMACFEDDFGACIAHPRLPIAHRKAIRTPNLPERLFGEERRRTQTIPHAFGQRAVLKRMFAALARASQSWRRRVISEFELKQIEELQTELQTGFRQPTTVAASPTASRLLFSSNNRT